MFLRIACCLAFATLFSSSVADAEDKSVKPWWPAKVTKSLERAGKNRNEIEKALTSVAEKHREGMAFLVEHMRTKDLQNLKSAFLLENVGLAYEAWESAPWGKSMRLVALTGACARARLLHQVEAFIAPLLLGGDAAPHPLAGQGWPIAEAPRLRESRVVAVGDDALVEGFWPHGLARRRSG